MRLYLGFGQDFGIVIDHANIVAMPHAFELYLVDIAIGRSDSSFLSITHADNVDNAATIGH